MRSILTFLLFLAFAGPALAVDGVLEINQTCATQTGCFSGDNPGYPVTIDGTAGRSYRLTGDLIVPNQNTDGIVISTLDIGIDLNNFTIIRFSCEGNTTKCVPESGIGGGVISTVTLNRGISVKNGSIVGMGTYGVFLGQQAEVSGLRVRWNRLDGIRTSLTSIVTGNTVDGNGRDGIRVGSGSTVSGNNSTFNGSDGISATFSCTVSGNAVYSNGDAGIRAMNASTISGNTVRNSGGDGILASESSTVSGNTVVGSDGDGITADNGSSVSGNTVRGNGGYGLNLTSVSSVSAYRENVITANTTGTVLAGANRGDNYCDGPGTISSLCP